MDYYEYTDFQDRLMYIPNKVKDYINSTISTVKFMYRGEPLIVKVLLTFLLIAYSMNFVLIAFLIWAFVYGVIYIQ